MRITPVRVHATLGLTSLTLFLLIFVVGSTPLLEIPLTIAFLTTASLGIYMIFRYGIFT